MASLSTEVRNLVDQWMKWDKNPKTRKEIEDLVASSNEKELQKRLGERIAFGTAGLRGAMQAGFACMNDLTIIQASQGLCVYLEQTVEKCKSRGIVVGYDGRHNSKTFADLTAATFLSRGFTVYKVGKLCATPLVPFCVNLKQAVAGIMVTASHNPKDDNGYKVYWSNGAQIVSPHDVGISKCIKENLEPWHINVQSLLQSDLLHDPTQAIIESYFPLIREKCSYYREENAKSTMKIVFTPMHGVGKDWVALAFEAFSIPPYIPVPEQIEADGDFPTVAFPNPEEGKGALELAIKTAEKNDSKLIVANDPDSDRLAVAEKLSNGEWKIFTGNEIGILLAHWVWTQYKKAHKDVVPAKCAVINSTVSSKMLKALAAKEGLYYDETLTGFKWLGNRAEELKKQGYTFLFAFEEAIGFMVSDICLDKDGVRGAAVFAEMALFLNRNGTTVNDHLNELYKQYGYFATKNRYFFCYDPKVMESIFKEIRNGGKYCETVGPYKIKDIRDLTTGYDTSKPDKKPVLPISSSTHMITFTFENGTVGTLRGSGTEPKLKYYVELNGNYDEAEKVRKTLDDVVDAMIKQLLQPEKNGLTPPKD
eukprot:TRINITY_DN7176_c0_g1_i1.p1 TRINITY_DN7176_c0_g1~~TRINITY_DN7176_c0_g1_i1.p1  ORF type:complete len:607 (-),score=197.81 TRINITY_DN7176_c0_g1_i1:64-1842(-)